LEDDAGMLDGRREIRPETLNASAHLIATKARMIGTMRGCIAKAFLVISTFNFFEQIQNVSLITPTFDMVAVSSRFVSS
jgi:hypothetical protein